MNYFYMNYKIEEIPNEKVTELYSLMRRIYSGNELQSEELFKSWMKNSGQEPFVRWFVAKDTKTKENLAFTRWYLYDVSDNEGLMMLSWTATDQSESKKGVTFNLVTESYKTIEKYWAERNINLKGIFVQTDISNLPAREFYKKVLSGLEFSVTESIVDPLWSKGGIVFIIGRKN